jgi:hypothetical protein
MRYGAKKNGYHGGVSLQEVVVPLVVLAPTALEEMPGWTEVPAEVPPWWLEATTGDVQAPGTEMIRQPAKPKKTSKGQGELFAHRDETGPPVVAEAPVWLDRLFESEVFQSQRALHRRVKLDDERIRKMLLVLDERGQLTQAALAQRLGVPEVRLPGIIAAVRRVLNLDGYDVIHVDDASDTISFDRELLVRQFEIKDK